jgi:hypothetical protein
VLPGQLPCCGQRAALLSRDTPPLASVLAWRTDLRGGVRPVEEGVAADVDLVDAQRMRHDAAGVVLDGGADGQPHTHPGVSAEVPQRLRERVRVCVCVCASLCASLCASACVRVCVCACVRTLPHTHTHTHTCASHLHERVVAEQLPRHPGHARLEQLQHVEPGRQLEPQGLWPGVGDCRARHAQRHSTQHGQCGTSHTAVAIIARPRPPPRPAAPPRRLGSTSCRDVLPTCKPGGRRHFAHPQRPRLGKLPP